MTQEEIAGVVREVTDAEVDFYREHGWVMLRRLVAPEFAETLLEVGLAHREATDGHTELMTRDASLEPYRSFMFSERMEANATRLCDRKRLKGIDVPLRYRYDNLVLTGDWIDFGLNIGYTEGTVISGLQAGQALRERVGLRHHQPIWKMPGAVR